MGITLQAFQIETGYNLIDHFSNLAPDDIEEARQLSVESLKTAAGTNILEAVLDAPKLPDVQINLKSVIKKVGSYTNHRTDQVLLGAALVYKMLTKFWPKLYPSNPSFELPSNPNS